ncbi:MAG: DUF1207 domain-containing protein [Planctomycetaceae bacterium]|nr:DUF1207 domain-containing protein [Planctomycetaceae bacterium]
MKQGHRVKMRGLVVAWGICLWLSGTGLQAWSQLHLPEGLVTRYQGTVPPASNGQSQQPFRVGPAPGHHVMPPSVREPIGPGQIYQSSVNGVPSAPPAVPPMYALRNAETPNYLPLPGGYSHQESLPTPEFYGDGYIPPGYPLEANTPDLPSQQIPPQAWTDGTPQQRMGIDYEYCEYCGEAGYTWTVLPKDLLWQSYLGGPREPRLAQSIVNLKGTGWLWELEAGGRAGLLRYGSAPGQQLEGWQLDIWGGAFPRLNMKHETELDAVDFKVGVPITYMRGPFQFKLEWYHISAHVGDEFLLRPENAGFNRLDYLRDSIVLGAGYFPTPDWRLYGEVDYAYNTNGGAAPWHFQVGVDYSPCCVTPLLRPQPFFAVNGHFREEVNYSGGINVVAGMQWRGTETNHLFRTGLHYYAGQSLQYSFLGDYEEFLGWGMWLDF